MPGCYIILHSINALMRLLYFRYKLFLFLPIVPVTKKSWKKWKSKVTSWKANVQLHRTICINQFLYLHMVLTLRNCRQSPQLIMFLILNTTKKMPLFSKPFTSTSSLSSTTSILLNDRHIMLYLKDQNDIIQVHPHSHCPFIAYLFPEYYLYLLLK